MSTLDAAVASWAALDRTSSPLPADRAIVDGCDGGAQPRRRAASRRRRGGRTLRRMRRARAPHRATRRIAHARLGDARPRGRGRERSERSLATREPCCLGRGLHRHAGRRGAARRSARVGLPRVRGRPGTGRRRDRRRLPVGRRGAWSIRGRPAWRRLLPSLAFVAPWSPAASGLPRPCATRWRSLASRPSASGKAHDGSRT